MSQHLLAQELFPHRERRRRKVDDRLCPGLRQDLDGVLVVTPPLPEIPVVPDVLADADAQPPSLQFQNLRLRRGFEIPVLVEYIVGRQQRLMEDRPHRPVPQQHRAVEQWPPDVARIGSGHPHQHRRPVLQFRRDARQRLAAALHKAAAHQQIAGQVPHQRQFGRRHQVSRLGLRGAGPAYDERRVPVNIPGGRIDLEKCDPQAVS